MVVTYGGDEVNALVIDMGHHTTRAGHAGEDTPKVVVSTSLGCCQGEESSKWYVGDSALWKPKEGMEILNPFSGNSLSTATASPQETTNSTGETTIFESQQVSNWDAVENLWNYCFHERLGVRLEDNPILISESSMFKKGSREKMVELAFEKFKVPATYLSKDAVLSAFSAGRYSGLIVNVGASGVNINPVHDGYVITNGHVFQRTGGNFLTEQCRYLLEHELKVPIVTHYEVLKKFPVNLNVASNYVRNENLPINLRPSFRNFWINRVVEDFKECVLQVGEIPFKEQIFALRPNKTFEFPDGMTKSLTGDRYKLAEILFNPKEFCVKSSSNDHLLGLHELVAKSLKMCDPELRSVFASNIILTGGGSLVPGLDERLLKELGAIEPGLKIKINFSSNTVERRHGAWIGGSILASLGSFHQLWISKAEYEEHGPSIVEKRCQ